MVNSGVCPTIWKQSLIARSLFFDITPVDYEDPSQMLIFKSHYEKASILFDDYAYDTQMLSLFMAAALVFSMFMMILKISWKDKIMANVLAYMWIAVTISYYYQYLGRKELALPEYIGQAYRWAGTIASAVLSVVLMMSFDPEYRVSQTSRMPFIFEVGTSGWNYVILVVMNVIMVMSPLSAISGYNEHFTRISTLATPQTLATVTCLMMYFGKSTTNSTLHTRAALYLPLTILAGELFLYSSVTKTPFATSPTQMIILTLIGLVIYLKEEEIKLQRSEDSQESPAAIPDAAAIARAKAAAQYLRANVIRFCPDRNGGIQGLDREQNIFKDEDGYLGNQFLEADGQSLKDNTSKSKKIPEDHSFLKDLLAAGLPRQAQ